MSPNPGGRDSPFPLECEAHLSNDSRLHDEALFLRLVDIPERVLALEGQEGPWDVSIQLTSDDRLRELHAEFLDDNSVTDVMSFLYGTQLLAAWVTFGEIVISVDRAAEQAIAASWELEQELSFLLVHGVLHLCGWDDETEIARAAMHARQREIMELLELA